MDDEAKIILVDNGLPVAVNNEANQFIYNLLPIGRFYDKRYGEVNITGAKIRQLADNFGHYPAYEVPVKIGHDDGARSPGKVIAAIAKDDGLEITMLVDAETAKAVNDKQYRYMSAEFVEDYQDKKTGNKVGPVLLGAALVNQPANPYMQPIKLADDIEGGFESMNEIEDLKIRLSDTQMQLKNTRKEFDDEAKKSESQAQKISELEAEVKVLREERERAEKNKHEAEVKAFCERWSEKIPPAVIESVKPLLLSDTSKIIKLSDEENISTMEFFEGLFSKFPEFATKQFSDSEAGTKIELSDVEKARERGKAIAESMK